jgi:hypothetical protein
MKADKADRQRILSCIASHTNQNVATTAYTSGTGLQSTDEDRRGKLPR